MYLELIKVTKDLCQDTYKKFISPANLREGESNIGYNGDLSGWIDHFKKQGVKTYLRYGTTKYDLKKTCALYREVLPSDSSPEDYLKSAASKVLATELSNVEGYVYPQKAPRQPEKVSNQREKDLSVRCSAGNCRKMNVKGGFCAKHQLWGEG